MGEGKIMTTLTLFIIAAGLAQQPQWVVPAGFHVTVFADSVENAREMALGPQGTVFVGSMRAGKVHAVIDRNGDHKADRVVLIASGLDEPPMASRYTTARSMWRLRASSCGSMISSGTSTPLLPRS